MSKFITVFGATGNQGGSVIKAILADAILSKEFKIRGITRDVSKPAAQALTSKGVEMTAVSICQVSTWTVVLTCCQGRLELQTVPPGRTQRFTHGLPRDELLGDGQCGGGDHAGKERRRRVKRARRSASHLLQLAARD